MKVRSALISLLCIALMAPLSSATADTQPIKVMSRNLYLGSDVGVALAKIPNMPAAAQFMWEQVQKTDFSKRKKILAAEIQSESPDVIGIQEATIWYCKAHFWSSKTEVFNFTKELLGELDGEYIIAEKDGVEANNPGYSIGPIPFLTKVSDAKTFQPLFGQNNADCGFQI
jgi:hypothetical protein